MDDIYQDFWETFLEETGTPDTTVLTGYTYFGDSEEASVEALELLLSGEKTAVGHCLPAYMARKQRMPRVGDYTVVTDFYGNPCCILHTVDVTIAPLPEIPETLRRSERPELSPEDWLADKLRDFEAQSRAAKFHFHRELPVLLETVERVYPN